MKGEKDISKYNKLCAFTIEQFCAAHGGISRTHFYELRRMGQGPDLMKVGGRRLISVEAAAKWRRCMELSGEDG